MYDAIMVPLDGSELAEQALPYAEQLAASTGGTLHLVRVVEPPSAVRSHGVGAPVNVYAEVILAHHQEASTYLEDVRQRITTSQAPVTVKTLDGYAAAALLDYAREAAVDVIVMTSHGRSGLTRWALGSVADRVTQGGIAAVLVVPAKQSAGEL